MAARHNQTSTQPSTSERMTVIGAGILVNGRVSGEEDLHVEGRVEGNVALSETLFVAEGGLVVAEIQARDVVVSGVVVGNVTALNSITLNVGAKLSGDISAPRVIIADGASFSGRVSMGSDPAGPGARERARPRARQQGSTAPARKSQPRAAVRAAAPPPLARTATARSQADDDVTVVVRHSELNASDLAKDEDKPGKAGVADKKRTKVAAKKKTRKAAAPRARVPKPGKRRVSRR